MKTTKSVKDILNGAKLKAIIEEWCNVLFYFFKKAILYCDISYERYDSFEI